MGFEPIFPGRKPGVLNQLDERSITEVPVGLEPTSIRETVEYSCH